MNRQQALDALLHHFAQSASVEDFTAVSRALDAAETPPQKTVRNASPSALARLFMGKQKTFARDEDKDTEADRDKKADADDENPLKEVTDSIGLLAEKVSTLFGEVHSLKKAVDAKACDDDDEDGEDEDLKKSEDNNDPTDPDEDREEHGAKDGATVLVRDLKPLLANLPKSHAKRIHAVIAKAMDRAPKSGSAYAGIQKIAKTRSNVSGSATAQDAVSQNPKGLGEAWMSAMNPHYQEKTQAESAQPKTHYWA